ncbi:MAG: J domain-containing protein [Halobacteriales archaeon]
MDPHDVLGVDEDAGVDEIRDAYAEAAERLNPDAPDGDPEEFGRVKEAYERLMEAREAPEPSERRKEADTGREDDVLVQELRMGWNMYRTPEWEFYVARPEDFDETTPEGGTDPRGEKPEVAPEHQIEGERRGMEYVGPEGSATDEPSYFEDDDDARKAFARHLKHRKIERETPEEDVEAEDEGWGESIPGRRLDGDWSITHQERQPLGERRRWAVYSEGDEEYLDVEGRAVEDETWFDTETEAVEAHETHRENQRTPSGPLAAAVIGAFYVAFVLPVDAVVFGFRPLLRLLDIDVRPGVPAELCVVAAALGLGYLAAPWFYVYAALQVASYVVYWLSPYDFGGVPGFLGWLGRRK